MFEKNRCQMAQQCERLAAIAEGLGADPSNHMVIHSHL